MSKLKIPGLMALVIATASLLLALGTGTASAFPKLHECQHPMTTGQEAYNLHNISVKAACKEVRKLATYLGKTANVRKLYGCHRAHPNEGGTPFLKQHTFDGYDLHIAKSGAFVMSQGSASFSVTGTDFPLNCS
jgi:hypothetical protein